MPPILPERQKGAYDEYDAYFKAFSAEDGTTNMRRLRNWGRADCYVAGEQWLELNKDSGITDPVRTPSWRPLRNPSPTKPRPVQNECFPAWETEVARLVGIGSRPYVNPSDDKTENEQAAMLAKNVLLDAIKRKNFYSIDYRSCDRMVRFGPWIVRCYWDLDYTKLVKVPAPDCQVCGVCGPFSQKTAANSVGVCPKCGSGATPWSATPEESKKQITDFAGNPLYSETPLGDVQFESIAPYELFLDNRGIDQSPLQCDRYMIQQIRTVEWVQNHFKTGKVEPEKISEIMKWHPAIGVLTQGGRVDENEAFDHHVRVRTMNMSPWIEDGQLNAGRQIVIAGGEVLLDREFMISPQSGGDLFPREVCLYVPWAPAEHDAFGQGLVDLIYKKQDAINIRLAQVMNARHKFGSPKLLAEDGMDLTYAGAEQTGGYDSDIMYYRPGTSGTPPREFGNRQMSMNWVEEHKIDIESIGRIGNSNDVAQGTPPPGVTAAQAMIFLEGQGSKRREPRIGSLRDAKIVIYRHALQLIQEFYREERYYKVSGNENKQVVKSFKGADLHEQTDVMLEDEPAVSNRMFRSAAVRDGLQFGTIKVSSARSARKINQYLDAPLDVNDSQNLQVEKAEREFSQWCQALRDPNVESDPASPAVSRREDNHQIHFDTHVEQWIGGEQLDIRDSVSWDNIELMLWGWEDEFDALQMAEQQMMMNPPGDQPPPPVPGPDGTMNPELAVKAEQVWSQRKQIEQNLKNLPRALQLRIFQAFTSRVKTALEEGVLDDRPETKAKIIGQERLIQHILLFKAHIETHRRLMLEDTAPPPAPGPTPPTAGPETTEAPNAMV